jgi:1-aminocyclopropane-1-carboxylate deaminase/D-cysteine desulfhydrase-like pyridoxal-dependent ACC family enzyme
MTDFPFLKDLPRRAFGLLPTPLHPVPELAKALGMRRPLLVKRDDLTGPGLGGNKVRKLEFLVGAAVAEGADALVTVGAEQSNHARLTAILGAACGLEVHLVLGGDSPSDWQGNQLLDRLAGARLHFASSDDWDVLEHDLNRVGADLAAQGHSPYVIPMGGSTLVGAFGYVAAYSELLTQLDDARVEADWIVHASSTGGTQAGLTAGRVLAGRGPRIFGADVAKGGLPLVEKTRELANALLVHAGADARVSENDVHTTDFAVSGYGEVTEEAARALTECLRVSGFLLDPVYSAKAMAALPDLDRRGALPGDGAVVFLHTGGHPALFADRYANEVLKRGGPHEYA